MAGGGRVATAMFWCVFALSLSLLRCFLLRQTALSVLLLSIFIPSYLFPLLPLSHCHLSFPFLTFMFLFPLLCSHFLFFLPSSSFCFPVPPPCLLNHSASPVLRWSCYCRAPLLPINRVCVCLCVSLLVYFLIVII